MTANDDDSATDAAPAPPPPSGSPVGPPTPPGNADDRDNPIAVAGLVVSVLALILAVVVLGFFVGIAGFALSAVGFRRARRGLRGRGLALGGMVLGLAAMAFSVVALLVIISQFTSTEVTFTDGVASPVSDPDSPALDLDGIECNASDSGELALASVSITNRSDRRSSYEVTVEWLDTDGDSIRETITTGMIQPGESDRFDAIELSGRALPSTCSVASVERFRRPFF